MFDEHLTETHIFHEWPKRTTEITQPTFTCSKLTIETLEQGVKYV